jgi:glucosyl-3-phosphoglycerate phosphatase
MVGHHMNRGPYNGLGVMNKNRERGKASRALHWSNFAGMTVFMTLQGRIFIARHGETVFNAAARMQGDHVHTPLTRAGFAQADAMGKALSDWLGTRQTFSLWSSPYGRALQTLAIVAEHIGEDWHAARQDDRLREIDVGDWSGRNYADVIAEQGEIMDRDRGLFSVTPPRGESYADIALRLSSWIEETGHERGDRLVIMHGMSARLLRGILLGLDPDPVYGAPIADNLPQGSMVMIGNGIEKLIHEGKGVNHA